MKHPLIRRRLQPSFRREDGITIVLVAMAMVAIVAMAALSIDVVTLYLARMEAQRAADAGALAAARVISVSSLTGDPNNTSWGSICGGSASPATTAAFAASTQGGVNGVSPTVTVSYSASGTTSPTCSGLPAAFGVNPLVTVKVTRNNLPTFFSRLWGNTGNTVNATAVAEAFNSSNSGNEGNNGASGTIIPVQPRCVKPWMVPNLDPMNPANCTNACTPFVDTNNGQIKRPGISLNGTSTHVIGETFWLVPDCVHSGGTCALRQATPGANYNGNVTYAHAPPNLLYVPGQPPTTAPVAVPSCAAGQSLYQRAVAGCDQTTVYHCGVQNLNTVELNENPDTDTTEGVACLIHEGSPTAGQPDGQDTLDDTAYPFKIVSGGSNPLIAANTNISASNSIVSVPIYDSANAINGTGISQVTIVGFLQVFINQTNTWGNVSVTVLNVTGCSNGNGQTVGTAVMGSSPVPVRLVTAP